MLSLVSLLVLSSVLFVSQDSNKNAEQMNSRHNKSLMIFLIFSPPMYKYDIVDVLQDKKLTIISGYDLFLMALLHSVIFSAQSL